VVGKPDLQGKDSENVFMVNVGLKLESKLQEMLIKIIQRR